MIIPTMAERKMAITNGSDDGFGVARLQLTQHPDKDKVKEEIFNLDIWCLIFEKVSKQLELSIRQSNAKFF